jgi:hypothetical protein
MPVWLTQLIEAQQRQVTPSPEVAVLAVRWRIRKAKRLLGQEN